ncbi:hypothetical protein I2750_12275 [Bacillus sp. PR5]|nr:hypothetical protein [Bacillus sp. PR5]
MAGCERERRDGQRCVPRGRSTGLLRAMLGASQTLAKFAGRCARVVECPYIGRDYLRDLRVYHYYRTRPFNDGAVTAGDI